MILDRGNIKISKIIGKLQLIVIFSITFIFLFFINVLLLEKYQDVSFLVYEYIVSDIKIFLVMNFLLALFLTLIIHKFPYSFTKRCTLKTLEFFNHIDPKDGSKLTILGTLFCILFSFILVIFSSIFTIGMKYSSLFINFSVILLILSFYYARISTKKLINLETALKNLDEMDDDCKSINEINKFSHNFKLGLKQIELKLQKDCSLNNIKLNTKNYKIDDFIQQINSYLFYGGREAKEEIKIFINNIKNNINGPKVNGTLLLENISEIDNEMTTFFNENSMNLTKPFSFGSSLIDLIKNLYKMILLIVYAIIYYATKIDINFLDYFDIIRIFT